MMKRILLMFTIILLLTFCRKKNDPVILNEATITVLHSTCVKTIVKIDVPFNAGIGVTWADTTKSILVPEKQVFEAGEMKNVPVTGLKLGTSYKVKIYGNATEPKIVCQMLDPVNSPAVKYDVEFLP